MSQTQSGGTPLPKSSSFSVHTPQSVQRTSGGGASFGEGRKDTPQSRTPKPAAEPDSERVKVVLRVRPALRADEQEGALDLTSIGTGQVTLRRPDAPVAQSDFKFDKVLGPGATQHDVYMAGVKDVVEDVLRGYNGTVMAYGQTGAGKTYTLGNTEPTAIGMIPRCVAEIFKQATADPFHNYSVTMSYIQIYMELIQDLLKPESENMAIREDVNNSVFIAGVHEVPVTTLQECLHYLELGEKNRNFAFTQLNAHSSRSHAVVMVTVVKRRKYLTAQEKADIKKSEKEGVISQKVKVGKLFLVDLAGSERLKKSGSTGMRASEARSINLSLTMLGMCISARANDERHVPFRDSKLTRLLQESLGGNAKTTLLVCVADAKQHVDESLQSLQFGSRAMCVKNKPVINERMNDYRVLHAELMAQLDRTGDQAHMLEVEMQRTEQERDALKAAMEHEKKHFEDIIEALRCEGAERIAQVSSELAGVRQVATLEQAKRTELETQLRDLENDNALMAQAHYKQVNALKDQIKELQASHSAVLAVHKKEAAVLNYELQATQQELAESQAHAAALQAQVDALTSQVCMLTAAESLVQAHLTELQSAIQHTLPKSLPTLPEVPTSAFSALPTDLLPKSPSPTRLHASSKKAQHRTSSREATPTKTYTDISASKGLKHKALVAAADMTTPAPATSPRKARGKPTAAQLLQSAGEEFCTPLPAPFGVIGDDDEGDVDVASGPPSPADTYDSANSHETRSVCGTPRAAGNPASHANSPAVARSLCDVLIDDCTDDQAAGKAEAFTGVTAAIQQQLSDLLNSSVPQMGHSVAVLQAHSSNQAAAIKLLKEEVLVKSQQVAELTASLAVANSDLGMIKGMLGNEEHAVLQLRQEIQDLQQAMHKQGEVLSAKDHHILELSTSLQDTTQALQEQQQAHDQLQQLHDRVQAVRLEAFTQRVTAARRVRAAATIQQACRRWSSRRLKARAGHDYASLMELEAARDEAAAAAHLKTAQLGAGMVLDSMTVMRDAVEALLTVFVGTRKELEVRQQLAHRIATAAPIISQARMNTTLSAMSSTTPALAPASSGAALAPSVASIPDLRRSMGSKALALVKSFTNKGLHRTAGEPNLSLNSLPPAYSGPMAMPRALTLAASYRAVAPAGGDFLTRPNSVMNSVMNSAATTPTRVTAPTPDALLSLATSRRGTADADKGAGAVMDGGAAAGAGTVGVVSREGYGMPPKAPNVTLSLQHAAAALRQNKPGGPRSSAHSSADGDDASRHRVGSHGGLVGSGSGSLPDAHGFDAAAEVAAAHMLQPAHQRYAHLHILVPPGQQGVTPAARQHRLSGCTPADVTGIRYPSAVAGSPVKGPGGSGGGVGAATPTTHTPYNGIPSMTSGSSVLDLDMSKTSPSKRNHARSLFGAVKKAAGSFGGKPTA